MEKLTQSISAILLVVISFQNLVWAEQPKPEIIAQELYHPNITEKQIQSNAEQWIFGHIKRTKENISVLPDNYLDDFSLDRPITRMEFLVLMVHEKSELSMNWATMEKNPPFADIDKDNSYQNQYINYATTDFRKFINGYGDNTFRPDAPINLAEASKMLFQGTFGSQESINAYQQNPWSNSFFEMHIQNLQKDNSSWYSAYILDMKQMGALPKKSSLKPNSILTGRDVARLIFQPVFLKINDFDTSYSIEKDTGTKGSKNSNPPIEWSVWGEEPILCNNIYDYKKDPVTAFYYQCVNWERWNLEHQ